MKTRRKGYRTSKVPVNSAVKIAERMMNVVRPSAIPLHIDKAPAACGPNVAPKVWRGPGAPVTVTVGLVGSLATSVVELADVAEVSKTENCGEMEYTAPWVTFTKIK